MGLLDTLTDSYNRRRYESRQNFSDIQSMFEKKRLMVLGEKLMNSGDFTPNGLQKFATENGLGLEEMGALTRIVGMFQNEYASRDTQDPVTGTKYTELFNTKNPADVAEKKLKELVKLEESLVQRPDGTKEIHGRNPYFNQLYPSIDSTTGQTAIREVPESEFVETFDEQGAKIKVPVNKFTKEPHQYLNELREKVNSPIYKTDYSIDEKLRQQADELEQSNKYALELETAKREKFGKNDSEKFKNETTLRKEFTSLPEVKSINKIIPQVNRVNSIMKSVKAGDNMVAVDQSLITIFNKMLDENSVVRESEYARTPQNLSLINRVQGVLTKQVQGGAGLTPNDRQALLKAINDFGTVATEAYNKQVNHYTGVAENYGLNPDNIVRLGGSDAQKNISPDEEASQFFKKKGGY